jgi:hypothetical protein
MAQDDGFREFFDQLEGLIAWSGAVVGRALDAHSTAPLDEGIGSIDQQFPRGWSEPQIDPRQDLWLAGVRSARARLLIERYHMTSRLADLDQALDDAKASLEDSWANDAVPAPNGCLAAYHDAYSIALAEQHRHTGTFDQIERSVEHAALAAELDPKDPNYRARLAIAYMDRQRAELNPKPRSG